MNMKFENNERAGSLKKAARCLMLMMSVCLMAAFFCGCAGVFKDRTQGQEPGREQNPAQEQTPVRIGSLKGPTSMGILFMQEEAEEQEANEQEAPNFYTFRMATTADELLPLMVKGELDIAMVPANAAAILYQRMNGGVCVVDINTLGVLQIVSRDASVKRFSDLKGKTIYMTGKGMTPEATIRYLLQESGLTQQDYRLEFKSEPTEVAALLAKTPDAVGLLPQPFVTAALMQNEDLHMVLDLGEAWKSAGATKGQEMVTGVTLVSKAFAQEHPEAVERFLLDHKESVSAIHADPARGAVLAVQAGIVAKEAIAQRAIPECNLVCVTGEEMEQALSAYLRVLERFDAKLIGDSLPGEDFYYKGGERTDA